MSFQIEIERLKVELMQAEVALQKRDPLLQQREELQNQTDILAQQVEQLMRDPSPLLEQKKDLLHQVKKKKTQLDHLLDEMEEMSLENVEDLRKQLAEKVIQLHPEKRERYIELLASLENNASQQTETTYQLTLCNQLIHLLEGMLEVRQQIRRRGILSYIFGTNPTMAITQYKQAAELLTTTALPRVTDNALTTFLKEFQGHCQQRWSFGRLDTFFTKALEEAKTFQEHFASQQKILSQTNKALKLSLDTFLMNS